MNILSGEIQKCFEEDDISIIDVKTALGSFSVLVLGFSQALDAQNGSKVELLFKENELSLAKLGSQIAVGNVFESQIKDIVKGKILWQIFLEQGLSSLITAKTGEALKLQTNDKMLCFVKPSDIIIKVL